MDNTDRILDDIKKSIKMSPPPAINRVLSCWEDRIDEITRAHNYTNSRSCCAVREQEILEMAIKQIQAACAIEKGDGLRALDFLLKK